MRNNNNYRKTNTTFYKQFVIIERREKNEMQKKRALQLCLPSSIVKKIITTIKMIKFGSENENQRDKTGKEN